MAFYNFNEEAIQVTIKAINFFIMKHGLNRVKEAIEIVDILEKQFDNSEDENLIEINEDYKNIIFESLDIAVKTTGINGVENVMKVVDVLKNPQ